LGESATVAHAVPDKTFSMDVNALNFCRFSLLPDAGNSTALLALPNLAESSLADIWELPAASRRHGSIGIYESPEENGTGKKGIIMALHLFRPDGMRLLAAYESGHVILWQSSSEHLKWTPIWRAKAHGESVMGMSVSEDQTFALSVSADDLLVRYGISSHDAEDVERVREHTSRHAGNGTVAIRDDGRVCAVGGWDGNIRIFSTKAFKALGTLKYHREGCSALAFMHELTDNSESDPEGMTTAGDSHANWLIAGGRDSRVSIWKLMEF